MKKKKYIPTKEKIQNVSVIRKKNKSPIIEFIKKYHLQMITLSISFICSFGIAFYSASTSKDIFPSPAMGFILILIVEIGLDTIRYVAVSVGIRKLFFINILMGILFILSVVPATIGLGENNKTRDYLGKEPVKSELISTFISENKTNIEQIKENLKSIRNTDDSNLRFSLRLENKEMRETIKKNKVEIESLNLDFKNKLEKYEQEKKKIGIKDPFYSFINDFLLKFLITGIQILNVTMSILGSMNLSGIKICEDEKEKKSGLIGIFLKNLFPKLFNIRFNSVEIPPAIISEFNLYEERFKGISQTTENLTTTLHKLNIQAELLNRHSGKTIKDMEELNGILDDEIEGLDA